MVNLRSIADGILFVALLLYITGAPQAQTIDSLFSIHATYYSDKFEGRKTASGEIFKQDRYTAAHKTLPFGTLLLVKNPKTDEQVIVKVNDRCPKANILDLTKRAARSIHVSSTSVEVQILDESYRESWKQQEGKPLESLPIVKNESSTKTQATVTEPQVKSTFQPTKQETKSSEKEERYHLCLCTVESRNEAEQMLTRLPLKYRDLTEVIPDRNSGRLIVRINLYATSPQVSKAIKELSKAFPLCSPCAVEEKNALN